MGVTTDGAVYMHMSVISSWPVGNFASESTKGMRSIRAGPQQDSISDADPALNCFMLFGKVMLYGNLMVNAT